MYQLGINKAQPIHFFFWGKMYQLGINNSQPVHFFTFGEKGTLPQVPMTEHKEGLM